MNIPRTGYKRLLGCATAFFCLITYSISFTSFAADHNDPNAINSIFSDVPVSAADLYDLFGFPSDDKSNGEKVVVQLTFAPIPKTGVFDQDLLYTIHLDPDPRLDMPVEHSLKGMVKYIDAIKDKYLKQSAGEIRVTFNGEGQARVDFSGFPGKDFSKVVDTNKVLIIDSPDGYAIKTYIGGRDDAFFNDLPGFFRSINYGPQFYKIPVTADMEFREFPIPKTLLELKGNQLFNYDPAHPKHGHGVKFDLPEGPYTWSGDQFKKDENGDFRFVYSGRDAQAGLNVNAIAFEIPLEFLTKKPQEERVVRTWGESWVLKASNKAEQIPDSEMSWWAKIKSWFAGMMETSEDQEFNNNKDDYKLVDVDGVPFLDAALNERLNERQDHNNLHLARHYIKRFAHLGWGFGPSISALGLSTCFDHSNSPVSIHKTYKLATVAFPRVKKCFFQDVNMSDDSWNTSGKPIKLKKTFEIFLPNVTSIDMDTTGIWPYGRRPEDQVASQFLALFLDMTSTCGGEQCNIETLNNLALWQGAPVVNKNPPNPLKNDKEFLKEFPYLAEPW